MTAQARLRCAHDRAIPINPERLDWEGSGLVDQTPRTIDVVFSADYSYLPHLATAVTSLLETNQEKVANIWVITDAGATRRFKHLVDDVASRYGFAVRNLSIDSARFARLYVSGHVSWATYARFLLGELLPHDVSRVLYLDSDLIVVSSLSEMLDFDRLGDNSSTPIVWAVARDTGEHLKPLGFTGRQYFNAGVLLVDLERWRTEKIGEELFLKGEEVFGRIHLWDQDVLNLVLENRWSELPGVFNETQVAARSDDYRIVHFVGGTKPWMVGGRHPYRNDYRRFRRMTPFWPFLPQGLGKVLRKRVLPRPLQRPVKTVRKMGRKVRRALGVFRAGR